MNTLTKQSHFIVQSETIGNQQPLRQHVENAIKLYFENLQGIVPTGLYDLVLAEVELPLLNEVLKQVRGNQTKAARLLGLSRGTLRKKMHIYCLD